MHFCRGYSGAGAPFSPHAGRGPVPASTLDRTADGWLQAREGTSGHGMDQLPYRRPRRGTQTAGPSPPAICPEPGGVPAAADHTGTKAMMVTRVADAGLDGQLELSHRVLPTGEAVAGIG